MIGVAQLVGVLLAASGAYLFFVAEGCEHRLPRRRNFGLKAATPPPPQIPHRPFAKPVLRIVGGQDT